MAFRVGDSFISLRKSDRTRSDYTDWTPGSELLLNGVAPLQHQIRVFVGNTEYPYLTGNEFSVPDNYWTYTEGAIQDEGVPCWGIRMTFDNNGDNVFTMFSAIALWDPDDELIPLDPDWSLMDEFEVDGVESDDDRAFGVSSPDTGFVNSPDNCLDFDGDTVCTVPGGTASQTATWRFPRQYVLKTFGWSSDWADGFEGDRQVENMKVEVNIGTPRRPVWVEFGSNLTQDVGNSAAGHEAGDSLTDNDYPDVDTLSEETAPDLLLTLSCPESLKGKTSAPVITLSSGLDSSSDKLTVVRETRQDQPWARPIGAALAQPKEFMQYFDQIRFIVQDLCDLSKLSDTIFGIPLANANENDYTSGNQMVQYLNHGGGTTFSYDDLDLLTSIPGAQLDDRHQIVVELGDSTDGTSDTWAELTYNASPGSLEYSVDAGANTITIGSSTSNDVRIRRSTRTDKWWYDPRTITVSGWNSLAIGMMQLQAKYMLQESCLIPVFYDNSPISESTFPRAWNWFQFEGTQNNWNIPGAAWGGDGVVFIYENDTLLEEGVDYNIEWPGIDWIGGEPGDGDTVDMGVGGGWGGGLGGGDDDDEADPNNDLPAGEIFGPPEPWPGFDPPTSASINVSVGFVDRSHFTDGDWEGGSFTPWPSTMEGALRVVYTVAQEDTISDGGGGFLPAGAQQVVYYHYPEILLGDEPGQTLHRVASAYDAAGDGTFESTDTVTSGISGAAQFFNNALNISSLTVTNTSPPHWQLVNALHGNFVDESDFLASPFLGATYDLIDLNQNAVNEGEVSELGWTFEQWQQFIDPDEDFTDFDIPE